MSKKKRFLQRLFNRGAAASESDSHSEQAPAADQLTKCIDGKRYRMRQRDGRWESFGPPIGDCTDDV